MEEMNDKIFDNELINKLKVFEVKPPADVWDNLSKNLDSKDRRRIIVYISYASAAVVALIFTIGGIYLSQRTTEQKIATISEPEVKKSIFEEKQQANQVTKETIRNKKLNPVKYSPELVQIKSNQENIAKEESSESSQEEIISTLPLRNWKPDFPIHPKGERIAKVLFSNNNETVSIAMDQPAKPKPQWVLCSSVFPVYSFHTSGFSGSPTLPNESGIFATGASFSFRRSFNHGVGVELGLSYGPFGQQIKDIYFVANNSYDSQVRNYPGLQTSFGKLSVSFSSTSKLMDMAAVDVLATDAINSSSFNKVDVTQLLGYVDIPVMIVKTMKYNRISIRLKSGLATDFLVNNNLKIDGDNISLNGKTEGVDRFIFTAIGSVGFSVPISGKYCLAVDPTFKYGLKPLANSAGNSHPFSTFIKVGIEIPF